MWDTFKKLLDLYVDVFKNYTLAASITTLCFLIGYFVWNKYYSGCGDE